MGVNYVGIWVLVAIACAPAAGAVTNSKGHGWGLGVALGGFLGVIGLLIAAFLPRSKISPTNATRECAFCRQRIQPAATVCPYYQRESEPLTWRDGRWWCLWEGRWYYLSGDRWLPS
jgi:hypothetical protein